MGSNGTALFGGSRRGILRSRGADHPRGRIADRVGGSDPTYRRRAEAIDGYENGRAVRPGGISAQIAVSTGEPARVATLIPLRGFRRSFPRITLLGRRAPRAYASTEGSP
jgi:hypothetical protein